MRLQAYGREPPTWGQGGAGSHAVNPTAFVMVGPGTKPCCGQDDPMPVRASRGPDCGFALRQDCVGVAPDQQVGLPRAATVIKVMGLTGSTPSGAALGHAAG